jgi:hypothetical protein
MDDLTHWIGEHVTREGYEAAVAHVDGSPGFPLVGWRFTAGNYRIAATWTEKGKHADVAENSPHDLMPPVPQIVVSEASVRAFLVGDGLGASIAAAIAQWLRETDAETVAAIQAAVREGRL